MADKSKMACNKPMKSDRAGKKKKEGRKGRTVVANTKAAKVRNA